MRTRDRRIRALAALTLLAVMLQAVLLPAAGVGAHAWSASWAGQHDHMYLGSGPVPEHTHAYDDAGDHEHTPTHEEGDADERPDGADVVVTGPDSVAGHGYLVLTPPPPPAPPGATWAPHRPADPRAPAGVSLAPIPPPPRV